MGLEAFRGPPGGRDVIRLIKRYESRKLYDTEESRYVSLEEIAAWVRQGQEIRVVDNGTNADVSAQTLTQIILDEGRRGTAFLPSELLHDLVRLGERAVSSGVEHVQQSVDRLMQVSIDRFGPVRRAREEMSRLRSRLEELETSLRDLELERNEPEAESGGNARRRPPAREAVVATPRSRARKRTDA
jgi:polyhydroxyalkanoate synthesis repressor PhaR